MSNLSELLPAGAGAKSASFVASGTLASGQAVALKTDGTVETIASVAQGVGAESVFEAATSNYARAIYDSNSNKVVIVYVDAGNSAAGTAIVGTVSGTSISFGTPATFGAAGVTDLFVTFDSTANKVVISYNLSGTGKSVVGTVSGTSISFGTAVVFNSAAAGYISSTFDSTNNKIVIGYRDQGNSNYGTAIVGTVSGTSISFGTEVVFETADTRNTVATFDSSNNKVVFAYSDAGNSNYGTAIVGTVSGTSISFGTAVVFESAAVGNTIATFDSTANKVVIGYEDAGNSYYGTAIVGTVSGTAISFGTAVVFNAAGTYYTASTFDSNANKVIIAYNDAGNSNYGIAIAGTVSGTSISFGAETVYNAAVTYYNAATFDSTNNKVVIGYRDAGNSNYGTAVVLTVASSNNTDFVGITDEAIANTASGSVIVQGGVGTGVSLPLAPVFGAESVFESAQTDWVTATFDSNSNKVVIAYKDDANSSYGTAVVGTVSGTSISFGTPVVFETGAVSYISTTFDSSSNRVVISYTDDGNSSYGTAVVGTVSGTSISFGTPVVFLSGYTFYTSAVYDSANNKIVIAYRDSITTNYGTAIVGTVSGTSISFGTAVVFESATSAYIAATYDSTNEKIVIAYQNTTNSNYGTAIVGTVSGTSISFGTAVVFETANVSFVSVTFDSTNNKVIIAYKDAGNSSHGTAVVGTVSSTAISFGTPVVFNAGTTSYTASTFNSSLNKIVISYNDGGNSGYGTTVVGTVSGTSISFGAETVFNTANTFYIGTTYDSNNNKPVIAYRDAGNSFYGTALVTSLTTALTIGTDYFVQGDGTLSTTSSTVPAGRALTTSSILLEG